MAAVLIMNYISLYIFRGFCVYVPLPPLRGQHTVLCHPRWLPTSGLTEFAVCWGEAGFEPRTMNYSIFSGSRTTDLASVLVAHCTVRATVHTVLVVLCTVVCHGHNAVHNILQQ
jgi:hypothetical protein